MILNLEGTVVVERNTALAVYRGLLVLRTIMKKQQQGHAVEVTDQLLTELEQVMPELPGLMMLRSGEV